MSLRLVSKFSVLSFIEIDEEQIKTIFSALVTQFLKTNKDKVKEQIPKIISHTIQVYYKIRAQMLPTPTKVHYLFNLLDIWKIFQGLTLADEIDEVTDLARLWYHECARQFCDRLILHSERSQIYQILRKHCYEFCPILNDQNFFSYQDGALAGLLELGGGGGLARWVGGWGWVVRGLGLG